MPGGAASVVALPVAPPAPGLPLDPQLQLEPAVRQRFAQGGRLRSLALGSDYPDDQLLPETLSQYDDWVEVSVHSKCWAARRKSGGVFIGYVREGRITAQEVRAVPALGQGHPLTVLDGSGKTLIECNGSMISERPLTVQTPAVIAAAHAGILAIGSDGSYQALQRERPLPLPDPAFGHGAVSAAGAASMWAVLIADGTLRALRLKTGRIVPPTLQLQPLTIPDGMRGGVALAGGEDFIAMLDLHGKVTVLNQSGGIDEWAGRLPGLRPAIRLHAGWKLITVQHTDGTWTIGGFVPINVEQQATKIGPAIDLAAIGAVQGTQEHWTLLWIEPQ